MNILSEIDKRRRRLRWSSRERRRLSSRKDFFLERREKVLWFLFMRGFRFCFRSPTVSSFILLQLSIAKGQICYDAGFSRNQGAWCLYCERGLPSFPFWTSSKCFSQQTFWRSQQLLWSLLPICDQSETRTICSYSCAIPIRSFQTPHNSSKAAKNKTCAVLTTLESCKRKPHNSKEIPTKNRVVQRPLHQH